MSEEKPLAVDVTKKDAILPILPVAPILSSAAMGWDNIHVGYYRQPTWETPEAYFLQHMITVYVGRPVNIELQSAGRCSVFWGCA
jgi:AraC family transcriptional regulator